MGNTNSLDNAIENKNTIEALRLIELYNKTPAEYNKLYNGLYNACRMNMPVVALALLETHKSRINTVASNGWTILMLACQNNMSTVALALIASGQSMPAYKNRYQKDTALIIACSHNLQDVALALIQSNGCDIHHKNCNGESALYFATVNKMTSVIDAINNYGKPLHDTKPEQPEQPAQVIVTNEQDTPLITACINNNTTMALRVIATGKSNPGYIDSYGNTALEYACEKNMTTVALALIATGQSQPGHIDNANYTALMWACKNKLAEVALALIETGDSNPGYIGNGETALTLACKNKMQEVALALIATGESNPEQVDCYRNTALMYACNNKMRDVIIALTNS